MKEIQEAYETSKTIPDYAEWAEAWTQQNPGAPIPNEVEFQKMFPAGNKGGEFVDYEKNNDTPWELGTAGKIGVGSKAGSVLGDILSLATAKKRQGETVDRYKDLATKYGEPAEVDPSAVNLATLNAGDKSDARTSTLATLLDQGVDPAAASKIIQSQKAKDTGALLNVLGQYGQQKGAAQMQADRNAMRFDAMAAQADTPIDYGQGISSILGKAGDLGLGVESLLNPLPTASARSGKKLKYEGGGKIPSPIGELLGILGRHSQPGSTRTGNMPVGEQASMQYLNKAIGELKKQDKDLGSKMDTLVQKAKLDSGGNSEGVASALYNTLKSQLRDGGNLQTTQGASDHSENPMMVTNKDGSPAVDEDGNQIELTGKETIIPDWLFEQLFAAYKKGPKELKKVFKDEIVEEERFNENIA